MRFGFTGSSTKTYAPQRAAFTSWISARANDVTGFDHGDCVEADKFAHDVVREFTDAHIIIHPPANGAKRAFCEGDQVCEPKPYLERNRDIAAAVDTLLAMPHGEEELRSGTWATVRAARRHGLPIVVFWPDGQITADPLGNSHFETPRPHPLAL